MASHPLLEAALDEAAPLFASRGWVAPTAATLSDAHRLLALTHGHRQPAVHIDADGSIRLEWEAGDAGWLTLRVDGTQQVTHTGVIDGDEYEQAEALGDALPEWAGHLLTRLSRVGH